MRNTASISPFAGDESQGDPSPLGERRLDRVSDEDGMHRSSTEKCLENAFADDDVEHQLSSTHKRDPSAAVEDDLCKDLSPISVRRSNRVSNNNEIKKSQELSRMKRLTNDDVECQFSSAFNSDYFESGDDGDGDGDYDSLDQDLNSSVSSEPSSVNIMEIEHKSDDNLMYLDGECAEQDHSSSLSIHTCVVDDDTKHSLKEIFLYTPFDGEDEEFSSVHTSDFDKELEKICNRSASDGEDEEFSSVHTSDFDKELEKICNHLASDGEDEEFSSVHTSDFDKELEKIFNPSGTSYGDEEFSSVHTSDFDKELEKICNHSASNGEEEKYP